MGDELLGQIPLNWLEAIDCLKALKEVESLTSSDTKVAFHTEGRTTQLKF